MKRIMAAVLGAVLIAGCAPRNNQDQPVRLWHWMADRHKVFQALAAQYEEQTGTKIKIDLYQPSVYSQKIIASAQARVLPDIYGILDKKDIFASFINSGLTADLTEAFQADGGAWEKLFVPKALDANRFTEGNVQNVKPGLYGVPIDVANIQMVYNTAVLEKAGVTHAPQTLEEFLSAAQKIRATGLPVFVSGWGEIWMIDAFASNYAFNIMGEEKVMDTYQGRRPYTDPGWIKVFEVFQTLAQNHVFIDGIVTKSNKQAEQDFALERAAFAFNGSWCVNVYNGMNPRLKYETMLPPAAGDDFPMKIWGGAGSSFVVNHNSPRKDQAVAFLKWLTGVEQQAYLARETRNLPANREALKDIPEALAGFASTMDSVTHPAVWMHNEHPLVSEAFAKSIQAVIIGDKTPQQAAEDVQKVKERVMAK